MSIQSKTTFIDSSHDFERTLSLARAGETELLGGLLGVYRNYLLLVANKRLSLSVTAKVAPSDLVQETLFKASVSIGEFQGTTEVELRTWLRKILVRKVSDAHRHYCDLAKRDVSREVPIFNPRGRTRTDVAEKLQTPLTGVLTERLRIIEEILDGLTCEQRTTIQLRTFQRLSFEAVGKKIGRTKEAARKIWTRAIQKMTMEFQSYELRARSEVE